MSTTRWPYNHWSVSDGLHRRWNETVSWGKISKSAFNNCGSLKWSLLNVTLIQGRVVFAGVYVPLCVCVMLFDITGCILTQKKVSWNVMMYAFCLWCAHGMFFKKFFSFFLPQCEQLTCCQKGCSLFRSQPIDKVHLIHLAGLFWWLTI